MNTQELDARVEDIDELLAGVRFSDPYRWLEGASDDVRRWQDEQEKRVEQYLAPWPHTNALRESVARHSTPRFAELPEWAAGLWFRKVSSEDSEGVRVVASSEPLGPGRVLFDTIENNETRPLTFLGSPRRQMEAHSLWECASMEASRTRSASSMSFRGTNYLILPRRC